jgi:hypothetical protein
VIADQLGQEAARHPMLGRMRRLLGPHPGSPTTDYRAIEDGHVALTESMSALGFFSVLLAVLTAGAVVGRGFAPSDVVVLLIVQLVTSLLIWRAPWRRVSEVWLFGVVGIQAVFVGSLITITGGDASPFLALYAPVLTLAGWHLRPAHAALAVGFVAATELWRAVALADRATFEHLTVALPAFGLLTLLARLTSQRFELAVVLNRRDQVRTAATLYAVRALSDLSPDDPLRGMPGLAAEVFDAVAWIHEPGVTSNAVHQCADPESAARHMALPIHAGRTTFGTLRVCRQEPFSSSERRLAAILADAMGRAIECRGSRPAPR